MEKFCPDCGFENREKAQFCNGCGFKFDSGIDPSIKVLDNRYRIIKKLSSGGMGSVYRAEDTRLGKIVAVKEMDDGRFHTEEEKKKAERDFRREAALLSGLDHPSLPGVTDFFTEDDSFTVTKTVNGSKVTTAVTQRKYYIVMSLIEGKTIGEIMKERFNKPFEEEECLDYFYMLLNILDYLHSQNPPIIYRDMKADNVMIADNGKIYLIDFGIAKIFEPASKGTIIGTPGYAAPEQYRGVYSVKSDIYSLGVLFHYMLTGINPEHNPSDMFDFVKISEVNASVSPELESMVMKMIRLKPEDRPASIGELMLPPRKSFESVSGIFQKRQKKDKKQAKDVDSPKLSCADIFEAIENNDLKAIEFFIRNGTDLNEKDSLNRTPLNLSLSKGGFKTARILIQKGADPNVKDSFGNPPLCSAVKNGKTELTSLLLDRGAEINAVNSLKETPLHLSISKGHKKTTRLLIERGADVNLKDSLRNPSLCRAVENNDPDLVKLLVEKGADINMKDSLNRTPLEISIIKGNERIEEYLKSLNS